MIVGALATVVVGRSWIDIAQTPPRQNRPPSGLGEWTAFALVHFLVVAFLVYLPLTRRSCRWFFTWRTMRRTLVGAAVLATLLAIFYAEENWRGKRAWEQCKRDLAAKGELLDWAACIPAPIPDDENIIKAPKMAEWFIKPKPTGNRSNELSAKLGPRTQPESLKRKDTKEPILIARLVRMPADATAADGTDAAIRFGVPDTSERLRKFVADKVGPSLSAVQGNGALLRQPLDQIKPGQVMLQTDTPIEAADVLRLLPTNSLPADLGRLRVEADAGQDSFCVLLAANQTLSAEEYLSASDRCVPDLDLIRAALKRPGIRFDDDYQRPFEIPIINFVAIRNVAQLAAQRAQCCLLLGRPDQAFRELLLIFELRRLLASKPVTLVAAMIDVAVMGLCADVVADGFRLQAWREPELAALQAQLQQVNLLSGVAESFRMEPIAVRHTIESSSPRELARIFTLGRSDDTFWKRSTDPVFLFLKLAPRGWLYQNLTLSTSVTAPESFDAKVGIIKPGGAEASRREIEHLANQRSPYTFLATIALPNYTRATQTTARNQTKLKQALVVCALKRYRLTHGGYPANLGALVPQFVEELPRDVIGGQPLKYRRTDDGQFVLYSVGWNEQDDGGQVVLDKDGSADREKGDWVWPLATK